MRRSAPHLHLDGGAGVPAGRQPARAFYILLINPMLYHVWLQGFELEARDSADALAKACQKMRDNPAAHIRGVGQGGARKSKHGVLWRLITGK